MMQSEVESKVGILVEEELWGCSVDWMETLQRNRPRVFDYCNAILTSIDSGNPNIWPQPLESKHFELRKRLRYHFSTDVEYSRQDLFIFE